MTPEEYGNQLLEEAKEINFQYKLLNEDVRWLSERMDAVNAQLITATTDEQYKALEKEIEMIRRKFAINLAEQQKARQKMKEFDLKLAGFKGGTGT